MVLFFNSNGKENPFENEQDNEWDDYVPDTLEDNGEPGVPVRALFDYKSAEDDELSFNQGKLDFFMFII